MTSPEVAPRTAAGRALVEWIDDIWRLPFAKRFDEEGLPLILAIEAEAAAGTALDVERLRAADQAASQVHDYIWPGEGEAVGQMEASAAIWTIHNVLRPIIAAASEPAAGEGGEDDLRADIERRIKEAKASVSPGEMATDADFRATAGEGEG
jgi:hypothetical protein